MLNFGTRLKEERKRLGMSQTEFAAAVGVHLNTQSRYEKGDRTPDATYLDAIKSVGVDLGYVLSGTKKISPEHNVLECSYDSWGRAFTKALGFTEDELMAAGKEVSDRLDQRFKDCPSSFLIPADAIDHEYFLVAVELLNRKIGRS